MIKSVQKKDKAIPTPKDYLTHEHKALIREWKSLSTKAKKNPNQFWIEQAKSLTWDKPFKKGLKLKAGKNKAWNTTWFEDGKLNASVNCLDVHLKTSTCHKAAILWEGEPGDTRTITYFQLSQEVCKLANALKKRGIKAGDVVAIYMGMVPEAIIAMLACSRLGATHNVVFGGFSAEALRDRMNDSKAVMLLTQDGAFRRGEHSALKSSVHNALSEVKTLNRVLVLKRTGQDTPMLEGRDEWWQEAVASEPDTFKPASVKAEHPLFILYTSGSTGKPKGLVHSTGGYLTQAKFTSKWVFDLKPNDIYFCTADIGWITGHSYVTYGPLMNGATVFLYEGAPTHPGPDRFWSMIERHRVTIFYTAPTAIRSFMRAGDHLVKKHDLSSLRLLGSVGEPINPEAWHWYFKVIGGNRCPIVDTWWQTETGAIMVSPIPFISKMKAGTATLPLPGIDVDVVDSEGRSCKPNTGGYLVVKKPWPSIARTIHGDRARYEKTYFEDVKGFYFTGDGARRDNDGNVWIMGRVDDVVNVSGHRLGTAEVESALVAHSTVAEAAVVARPDDIKGSALIGFVVLRADVHVAEGDDMKKHIEALRNWVGKEIGPIAKPDEIRVANSLPKTRSGKIMRRLLRELVTTGKTTGDVSTLEDFSALESLRQSSPDEE